MPWIAHVRFAVGLEDHEPRWMCAACLELLQAAEASYSAGHASSLSECVWAISIEAEKGARAAVAST